MFHTHQEFERARGVEMPFVYQYYGDLSYTFRDLRIHHFIKEKKNLMSYNFMFYIYQDDERARGTESYSILICFTFLDISCNKLSASSGLCQKKKDKNKM